MTTSDSPPLEFDDERRAIALPGAEEILLKAVKTGGLAEVSTDLGRTRQSFSRWDYEGIIYWDYEYVIHTTFLHPIRAIFLRHLCLHPDLYGVDPGGINISGALIAGKLDLFACSVSRPLSLVGSRFDAPLSLMDATTRFVNLQGCWLPGLEADGLVVQGSLFFQDSRVAGDVRLMGVDIKGQLNCTGAIFTNRHKDKNGEGPQAFSADRLKVSGDVFLEGVKVTGQTRLLGADIEGGVHCTAAIFTNTHKNKNGEGGYAFNADGLTVGGNVSLEGVKATGETRLLGANIRGQLGCQGATFSNEGGYAFSADRLKVGGNVYLTGVKVTGKTGLLSANIRGQLNCKEASFANKGGIAFSVEHLRVAESLLWQKVTISGHLNFINARIDGCLVDDHESWGVQGKLWVDGFVYGWLQNSDTADMRLEWLELMPATQDGVPAFWPQPYEQLIKVFKDSGHEHEARKVAIAKQDAYAEHLKRKQYVCVKYPPPQNIDKKNMSRANFCERPCLWCIKGRPHILERFVLFCIKWTAGYGYKPWRSLYWLTGFLAVGAICFAWVNDHGLMEPAKERVYTDACYVNKLVDATQSADAAQSVDIAQSVDVKKSADNNKPTQPDCSHWIKITHTAQNGASRYLPPDYPEFNAFVYSLDVLLPIVDLHQEDYWEPASEGFWGGALRFYFWLHIAAGWVLATIAVTGFTGVLKKD